MEVLQDYAEELLSTSSGFKLLYDPSQLIGNITIGSWQVLQADPRLIAMPETKPSSALGDHGNTFKTQQWRTCAISVGKWESP